VRISWLHKNVVGIAREALTAVSPDWGAHFTPAFEAPPTPKEVTDEEWPLIAEHVARAERVSSVVRERGLDAARARFGGSSHAIEQATLVAAAWQIDELDLELLEALMACEIDELVMYGAFLSLLVEQLDRDNHDRVIAGYRRFVSAAEHVAYRDPAWPERVRAARDGLAQLYVRAGRHDEGHALFAVRHLEDDADLVVALSASRSFLAAGEVGRAIDWLGRGAERATDLARPEMAERLRDKQAALRRRLN